MDLHELKRRLQDHLSDGLVIVVGSGLSCAEGMPGMSELADEILKRSINDPRISAYPKWQHIADEIGKSGLEAAFLKHQLPLDVEDSIMTITADYLLGSEDEIIEKALSGDVTLRFTRLLSHILKPNTGVQVVTTNYDRLVEVAAELAGLGVDTLFSGNYLGVLDPKESRFSHCRDVRLYSNRASLVFREFVCVYKPHGSFDWYQRKDTQPIRYSGRIALRRLIITPGINKFRNGYDIPFDRHREEANRAIEKASRFLILGYGFNDDHLETRLRPAIQSGKPTILLTRSVSQKAASMVRVSPNFIALEKIRSADPGTQVLTKDETMSFPGIDLWDLNGFVDEVLEP